MYRAASERSQPGTLRELFLSFSRANMEHIKFLTKARRETVIEMLLEPITGLGLEEQVLRAKQMIADQNLDDRNKAIQLEQTVQDLYNKTSAKVAYMSADTSELLKRLSEESAGRKNQLLSE
jgi:hypothetical protein